MKHYLSLLILNIFFFQSGNSQSDPKQHAGWMQHASLPSRNVQSFIYSLATFTDTYTDLTGTTSLNNGEIWDDPTFIMPMAFPFEINGHAVTELEFYGVGALMQAPTSDPLVYTNIFAFEADLIDRGDLGNTSLSPISYKVEGTPGSRIQKMEFKNAGSYYDDDLTMYVNFQMWLYEGSNMIEYHFGPSFINDPDLFYGGETGPYSGTVDYDEDNDILTNQHFIAGAVSNPFLTANITSLSGTPANGMVYRLYLPVPLELEVTGVNATSFCNPNGSASADATGGLPPYTYLWSNGSTTSSITNLDAGIYSVTVTDSNGQTATGSVTITNVEPLDLVVVTTDETALAANDGTAEAQVSGGFQPYNYQWNTGETTAFIENLPPGIYNVVVTDANGCTAEQTGVVNAFGCPELFVEASIQNVSCHGECDGSISIINIINGSGDYTYNWNNGSTLQSLTNLCAGMYEVTITDITGCIVLGSYEITQPDTLIVTTGSTNESLMNLNDGTAWVIPSGGTAPYIFTWSNGSTDSLIINLIPGVYTVTVTDDHGCSATAEATVEAGPCSIIQSEIINTTCNGDCNGSIILSVINNSPPITYTWSTGATTSLITDLCAGDFSVTVTDENGCSVIETFTVEEPALLEANAGSTDETVLGNDGTAWAHPMGGTAPYTYHWSNDSSDSLIINLMPGEYFVIVTDANGCTAGESVFIDTFICVEVVVTFSPISCFGHCDGFTSLALLGGSGNFSFEWNTGDVTPTLSDLCPGHYELTVTDDSQGCTSTAAHDLTQPEALNAFVEEIGPLTDTSAAYINLTISGGTLPYSMAWQGPNGFTSTSEDLFGIVPGVYSFTVIDANGCLYIIDSISVQDLTTGIASIPDWKLNIYPNPAHDKVFIKGLDINEYDIHLLDAAGLEIKSWKNNPVLDVNDVLPGWYFLKISFGKNTITRSLIIQR